MDSDHRQRNLGLVKKRGPLDAATPRRRWLAATLSGFPTQSMSRGQPPCCCSFLFSFAFSPWTMDMSDRLINNRGMTQGFLLSQVQISRTLPARNAMFWRQETSLGFNYPARRPRASRPSISSQLSLSRLCLPVCLPPFARLLPWRRSHGPFVRRHISAAASQTVLVLLARGHWRCPFASQKHTMRGLPRSRQRSGHPTWHHVVHLLAPETLSKTVDKSCRGYRRRLRGVSGPGRRPDWELVDRRRRGTAASTCQARFNTF